MGQGLLEKSVTEGLPRFGNIRAIEKVLELDIANMDTPFIGIIDLVGEIGGKETLINFMTSSSSYNYHEVDTSDQLTAYRLAEPEVSHHALCVLVKTIEPKIQWHVTKQSLDQLTEYLNT